MENKSKHTGLGLALGATLGAVAGVLAGNIGVWLAIGVVIGLALGSAFQRKETSVSEMRRHAQNASRKKLKADSL
jgi:predicted lysophospholipase L1 biosynthesis ABC-type transport system permease subunit